MTPPDATRPAYPYPTQSTVMLDTCQGHSVRVSEQTQVCMRVLLQSIKLRRLPVVNLMLLTDATIPKGLAECCSTELLQKTI